MDNASRLSDLITGFKRHHQALAIALEGIDSPPHRRWYSQVLLNRLLLLQMLQRQGALNAGDTWYLQNQLGTHLQQGSGSFYQSCLQPLFFQGLSLPPPERPLSLQQRLGRLPYLGDSLFQRHPLEQRYPRIQLADEPLEALLAWLAEQPWQISSASLEAAGAVTRSHLAQLFEYVITEETDRAHISSQTALAEMRDRTLHRHVLQAVQQHTGRTFDRLPQLLQQLDDSLCRTLVETVLPSLTVLDPACGSGRLLLVILAGMMDLYRACLGYAARTSDPALTRWERSLAAATPNPEWVLQAQIVSQNLYGVDRLPAAIETARLQLHVSLLATLPWGTEPPPLPTLAFNLRPGNALIGFIRVDEASFDRIPTKARRTLPDADTPLQGNLLQPLAAETYRTILTEKKIRIEHYRSQSQALGEGDPIPRYAKAEFLRDRITALNQTAQAKLNRLLLEEFSQKLGLRMWEPKTGGRPQPRLLSLKDVEALEPFHWGFQFNHIFETRGGFDLVITQPPTGRLHPDPQVFYYRYQTAFTALGIDLATWRQQRKQILQAHPQLELAWSAYAAQMTLMEHYCRLSDPYQSTPPPLAPPAHQRLVQTVLFARRCSRLCRPGGCLPYLLRRSRS